MNSFNCLDIGSYRIITNENGSIDTLWHGKKMRFSDDAREFVRHRPKLDATYKAWLQCRNDAISKWRHETPHYRFYCDGGTLAVRVDGGPAVLRLSCGGDGNHPIFILDSVPDFFKFTGVSVENATIEPLDYDGEGGKPICREVVKTANFYRHESAIAIAITRNYSIK